MTITQVTSIDMPVETDYHALNAMLNLYDADGKIQFDKDVQAARQYHLTDINNNMRWFTDLEEKIRTLVSENYYEAAVFEQYKGEFVKNLFKKTYEKKFRFSTFLGAFKFYSSYSMKTFNGERYIERFEDRVVMTALNLARGNEKLAVELMEEMISGRFQPATPTFLNSGKAQRGELVSCFPGESLVTTDLGKVRIDEISKGDKVLSHDGNYHTVKGTTVRDYDGELITINIVGNATPLVATKEHPILVHRSSKNDGVQELKGKDGETPNTVWVAAKDIVPGDMVIAAFSTLQNKVKEISILNYLHDSDSYETIDGKILLKNRDKKTLKTSGPYNKGFSSIKATIQLDKEFGRFVGYFLAEGYVMRHQTKDGIKGPKGLNFTFGTKELDFIADVQLLVSNLFGLTSKTKTNRDGSTNIYVNSSVLGEFFVNLIGTGFGEKLLPQIIRDASLEFQREILIGAYRGDGCTTGSAVTMSLTNPELIQQLKEIALRNGLLARTRNYESRSGRLAGQLDITGYAGNETDFILDVNKDVHKFVGATVHQPAPSMWVDGYAAYRVKNVTVSSEKLPVYNLEVEDTHTYAVNGFTVHNCFLVRIEDNMESISRGINSALQLSKRGGGVALLLTNLREAGAPIKKIEGQSSGIVPVMKLLEDSFSYSNQLGARPGAGAVYLNAHHPDIMNFLDTKRENADEKVRIKTLSLGIVVPDITFELAKNNEDMYLFSPYDVERVYGVPFSDISVTEKYYEMVDDARIKKAKINARVFFQTVAELQFESGYPYIVFEDTVNKENPIKGRINMSNLCSEILQVNTPSVINEDLTYQTIGKDISCNLGSLNIALAMDGKNFGHTIETAIRALTSVSQMSSINSVPPVREGNDRSHAIGLGQMNLHGYLARERIHYGSEEGIDFTNIYFYTVAYHAVRASNLIAKETGETFEGFADSKYATGEYFDKYINQEWKPATKRVEKLFADAEIAIPTQEDWAKLAKLVAKHGIYNQNLQAVPPTGSISYINHSTSSIHPIASQIEIRKEGKMGRVYYPAPFMTNDNLEYYQDAYEIGPDKIIDTYAAATQHVDQGLSLTLFFKDTATTRDINRAQIYAWKKGIKTIYYIRIRQMALEGTDVEGCVSCAL